MSLLFTDGHGYCDFDRSDYKYIYPSNIVGGNITYAQRSNFWDQGKPTGGPGWSSGARAGLIDYGPYLGTSSLHMQATNPIWYRCAYLGDTRKTDLIVSMWLYPINIVGSKTFLLFQQNTDEPNFGSVFAMWVRDDGKIVLGPCSNDNANFFPALFNDPTTFPHWPTAADRPGYGVSKATIPINTAAPPAPGGDPVAAGWTHVCMQIHFDGALTHSWLKLWINGCLDTTGTGLNMVVGSNLVTPMWQSTDGSELCFSQFVIADPTSGSNTSNVSQFARIETIFPNNTGLSGWSGGGVFAVNANPGPLLSTFLQCNTLAHPDELLLIPATSGAQQVLGVGINLCMVGGPQSMAGLVKKSGSLTPTQLATLVPFIANPWTQQVFSELDPTTGLPWLDADISAAGWGMRGLTGTGEQCFQFFLEKLWQSSKARCGGYSYTY